MTRPGPGARLDAGRFTLPWSPGLAGLFPLIDDGIAEPEPPSNVRREAALRYYRERAERNCAGVLDMWRRHGLYLSRTTPALDARALEVEPGVWEFYRVEREPSDIPSQERWRVFGKDWHSRGRIYLPPGSTAEDAWRRAFADRYNDLVVLDAVHP